VGICTGLVAAALAAPAAVVGQWVEEPGKGWVSVQYFYHDTRDRFDQFADETPFFADGHAVSNAVFATAALGLIPNWDVWVRVSWNSLDFTDAADERSRTGIGDTNVWLRVAPLKYFDIDFPFAIRGGVKAPTGDSPVDAEIIPLGEGQTDWEIMGEVGHSFWPAPYYVNGWVGYRWRKENEDTRKDPGEEVFFLAQVGGNTGRIGYKVIVEGWDGDTPVIEGIPVRNARREYLQITPSISWDTGAGSLELGWRFPVRGRNLPSGGALTAGYFTRFGF